MRLGLVLVGLAVLEASAHAQATVTVTLNSEGEALAQRLKLSVPQMIADSEARIDELYKVSRIDSLLRAFGNTAAFAQRALGVDYDTDPGDRMIGFTAAGVHGDIAIGTTNDLLGSIFNYTVMAGVNLGRWNLPRWTVFGNGYYQTTSINGVVGHLMTLGTHVQYEVVPPTPKAGARWMGVRVTSGLEYAHWTVGQEGSIESHFSAVGPDETISIHMSATGTLDVLSETYTIPLEVTTGVRLGGVFAVYAGGGASATVGNTSINASLDGVLSYTKMKVDVGRAHIEGSGENDPSALNAYGLAGLAAHTHHVRVFLQGALSSGELSASLGMRVVL